MDGRKVRIYRAWYYILLAIGLVGLVDLATRNIILQNYNIDVGIVAFSTGRVINFLLGSHIAALVMVGLATLLGIAPLWFALAYFFNRKSKFLENPSEQNRKGVKRAKITVWIIVGIFVAIMLYAMSLALSQKSTASETKAESANGSVDIADYLSGVGMIRCWKDAGNGLPQIADIEASGSLWKLGNDYVVLTNKHAILDNANLCLFITEEFHPFKLISINKSEIAQNVDAAAMQLSSYAETPSSDSLIQGLNYNISSMPKCPQKMPLGQPVKVIGYPAFSKIDAPGIFNDQSPRTVTDGVISAYESNIYAAKTPDYFISAKIDSGSSGGVALSIDQNKLCLLGIPTWLNVGQYDTQGIVQNIHNVLSN